MLSKEIFHLLCENPPSSQVAVTLFFSTSRSLAAYLFYRSINTSIMTVKFSPEGKLINTTHDRKKRVTSSRYGSISLTLLLLTDIVIQKSNWLMKQIYLNDVRIKFYIWRFFVDNGYTTKKMKKDHLNFERYFSEAQFDYFTVSG